MSDLNLSDLSGFGKPINKLINVIAKQVGKVFEPYIIKKTADANAYTITTIADAMLKAGVVPSEVSYANGDLKSIKGNAMKTNRNRISTPTESAFPQIAERANARLDQQKLLQQENIEAVCASAADQLAGETEVSDVEPEPEWTERFFDYASKVGTEEIRNLWGRVLAGELKTSGSYSLRTLDVLRSLSRREAELFQRFAQFVIKCSDAAIVPTVHTDRQKDLDMLSFSELMELSSAGLIFEQSLQITYQSANNDVVLRYLRYAGAVLILEGKSKSNFVLSGHMPTRVGRELTRLVDQKRNINYINVIGEILKFENARYSYADFVAFDGDSIRFGAKTRIY